MDTLPLAAPLDHRVRHVLLGVDLDGSSVHAADAAIALAAGQEAVLLILSVVPLRDRLEGPFGP